MRNFKLTLDGITVAVQTYGPIRIEWLGNCYSLYCPQGIDYFDMRINNLYFDRLQSDE